MPHDKSGLRRPFPWAGTVVLTVLAGAGVLLVTSIVGVLLVRVHVAVDSPETRYRTTVAAVVSAVAAALAVLAWRTNDGARNALIGRWHAPLRFYVVAVGTMVALRGLGWLIVSAHGVAMPVPAPAERLFARAGTSWFTWTLAVMYTVLLVPIIEELLFRRAVYVLLDRFSPWLAFAVSIASFALVHDAGARMPALLVGALAALLYQRSGSLLPSIACHATGNLGALAIYAASR